MTGKDVIVMKLVLGGPAVAVSHPKPMGGIIQ